MRRERKRKKKFQFNCHDVRRVFRKKRNLYNENAMHCSAGRYGYAVQS